MTIAKDTSGNAFDFDALPETGDFPMMPSDGSHTNDWDEGTNHPTVDLATNPLVATFSDLDLAPAREIVLTTEFDAEYWQE
ncbi:MAG TPA: hypothetical protein VGM94_12660 [Galbitalea sp.]|jgi:hypothetical protein